jgi:hypothetical protein
MIQEINTLAILIRESRKDKEGINMQMELFR